MSLEDKHLIEVLSFQGELYRLYAHNGPENGFNSPMVSYVEWRPMKDVYEVTVYATHKPFGNQRFDFKVPLPGTEGYSRSDLLETFLEDMKGLGACKTNEEFLKTFYGAKAT